MGFNSTIVVMNDALGAIEKDPEFGKKLAQAIRAADTTYRGDRDVSAGSHVNAATVITVRHADVMSIVAVGGNTGRVLARGDWRDSDEALLDQFKNQLRRRRGSGDTSNL